MKNMYSLLLMAAVGVSAASVHAMNNPFGDLVASEPSSPVQGEGASFVGEPVVAEVTTDDEHLRRTERMHTHTAARDHKVSPRHKAARVDADEMQRLASTVPLESNESLALSRAPRQSRVFDEVYAQLLAADEAKVRDSAEQMKAEFIAKAEKAAAKALAAVRSDRAAASRAIKALVTQEIRKLVVAGRAQSNGRLSDEDLLILICEVATSEEVPGNDQVVVAGDDVVAMFNQAVVEIATDVQEAVAQEGEEAAGVSSSFAEEEVVVPRSSRAKKPAAKHAAPKPVVKKRGRNSN